MPSAAPRIACFATGGTGSNDEHRIRELLGPMGPTVLPFDRANKRRSALCLLGWIARERPDLLVMEGTGLAGGTAVLLARHVLRVPYVVSSGDAIAPFLALRHRMLLPFALAYERMLYRSCSGFIGWTPYLVGRALTWGAPRAMTAANWPPAPAAGADARSRSRERLGIAPDALVFGLVGALPWAPSRGYCYGLDLVRAVRRCTNDDVVVVVVGEGDGRSRLADEAGELLGSRVVLPGAVARSEVPELLAAFDVAALPQSTDAVGSFRYTTKLCEYLAAGLPVVTGQIPAAYDLDGGWLWRLPGDGPWEDRYVDALAQLMSMLRSDELRRRAACVPRSLPQFDGSQQVMRVSAFIKDIMHARACGRPAGERASTT